jgi:hypothetical protein
MDHDELRQRINDEFCLAGGLPADLWGVVDPMDAILLNARERAYQTLSRTPEENRADLAALREEIAAAGITATSPDQLHPEAEQLARTEREN